MAVPGVVGLHMESLIGPPDTGANWLFQRMLIVTGGEAPGTQSPSVESEPQGQPGPMWGPQHSGHRQLSRKLMVEPGSKPFPDPPGTAPGEDGLGLCPWGQKAGHRLPDGAGCRPCRRTFCPK